MLTNPDLHEPSAIDGAHLPYEEATFDVVYSDWTMEHVERPEPPFREIHRVLKPGGRYWLRLRPTNLEPGITTSEVTHLYAPTLGASPDDFSHVGASRREQHDHAGRVDSYGASAQSV
ncbi:MAG: class I SAM-dependent methyltransferase [Acidimicrobiaceae bacterium]|nr:class I SAM-dependent methyltransferase [Acidimicrobiaceae bacterium]